MPTNSNPPPDPFAQPQDNAGPKPPPDPFGSKLPTQELAPEPSARAQAVLDATQDRTPDDGAQVIDLAERLGIPRSLVFDIPEAFREVDLKRKLRETLASAPVLSQFLSDPSLATASRDSVEHLAALEARITGGGTNNITLQGRAGRYVGSFFGGAESLLGSGVRGLGELVDLGGRRIGQPINDAIAHVTGVDLVQAERDARESNDTFNNVLNYVTPSEALKKYGGAVVEASQQLTPTDQNLPEKVAGGLGQIVSAVALNALFGPGASSTIFVGAGSDQQAQNLRRVGLEPTEHGYALTAGAAITGLSEQLRLNSIVKAIPKSARDTVVRNVFSRILGQAGEEAVQEAIEGISQNLLTTTYDSKQEILKGVGEQATVAGLSAAVFQGLIEVALPGKARGAQAQERAASAQEARDEIEQIPLFQRSPSAVAEFIEQAAEGETIELEAQGLTELFQSDPEAFRELAQELGIEEDAISRALDGDGVEIPVSKLLTLKDRDAFERLLDIARPDADSLTPQQARQQDEEGLIGVDLADLEGRFTEQDQALEGFERAQRAVSQQLIDAGRDKAEADAAGTLFGSFFRVLANAGLDEAAVFETLGLQVLGPEQQAAPQTVTLPDGRSFTQDEVASIRETASATIPNRPQTLGAFVRAAGLNPSEVFAGEVEGVDTSGLIDRQGGQDLDYIAQLAADAGYISLDANGKADVTEFIDALANDYRSHQLGNERTYRPDDFDAVQRIREQKEARDTLAEIDGIANEGEVTSDADALNQFVGEQSADPDVQGRIDDAKQMELDGFDRDTIWEETLVYRGIDNKWRAEIDDSQVDLTPEARDALNLFDGQIQGDQLLAGSEIDSSYPTLLSGIKTLLSVSDQKSGVFKKADGVIKAAGPDGETITSVALHEIQHAIQVLEGFVFGGGQGTRVAYLQARELQKFQKQIELTFKKAFSNPQSADVAHLQAQLAHLSGTIADASKISDFEFYQRLAGEVEARNVESRKHMSLEDRRANPPWETQDFDDVQQFLVGPGKPTPARDYVPTPKEVETLKELASPENIQAATDAVTSIRFAAEETLNGYLADAQLYISNLIKSAEEGVHPYLQAVSALVSDKVAQLQEFVRHITERLIVRIELAADHARAILETAQEGVDTALDTVGAAQVEAGRAVEAVQTAVSAAEQRLQTFQAELQQAVQSKIESLVGMKAEAVKTAYADVKAGIDEAVDKAHEAVAQVTSSVASVFDSSNSILDAARERAKRVAAQAEAAKEAKAERAAAKAEIKKRAKAEQNALREAGACAAGKPAKKASSGVGEAIAGNLIGVSVGGAGAVIFAYSLGEEERKRQALYHRWENIPVEQLREMRAASDRLDDIVRAQDDEEAESTNRYDRALEAHYADINNMPHTAKFDVNSWAERYTGVDAGFLDDLIGHEAADDWDAANPESTARGGAQFIESTWRVWLAKYGAKYGDHPDPYSEDAGERQAAMDLRNDRRWGTMIAAEFTRENVLFLQNKLNRPATGKEAYLAHFLGRDAALRALRADPEAIAADIFPAEAEANQNVFFKRGDFDNPRTVKEMIARQGANFTSDPVFPYSDSQFTEKEERGT